MFVFDSSAHLSTLVLIWGVFFFYVQQPVPLSGGFAGLAYR
jgi:hypothetical protein